MICVADVTGHGIPAAMNSAMLKTLLLEAVQLHASPAELLSVLNRRFSEVSLPEDFVSMILVRMEPHARRFQYASAGHEPAWLVSASDKLRMLASTGVLLGIEATATWEDVSVEATGGNRLFVPTDGLSETFNSQGEMFGRTRLSQLFSECRELTVKQAIRRIDETLTAYRGNARQHDDVTAVLLELTLDGD